MAHEWRELSQHGFLPEEVDRFRGNLRFAVCRKYPWLSAELFALEGLLGWGPGFREYDGEFFPPPLPEAPGQMTRFLQLLSQMYPNSVLADLIGRAEKGIGSASQTRMLITALNARIKTREHVVRLLYARIANQHSPYTLGGARMFLFLWTHQRHYALATAGIIWLLHQPLIPVQVRAETVRRKLMLQRTVSSSSANLHASHRMPAKPPPISGGIVPLLLHEGY